MKAYKILASAGTTALLLLGASVASAQVVSTAPGAVVGVTNTSSGVVTPGATGATVGTIQLNGNTTGTLQVSSLPITISGSGGAAASNLTNCQLYNASGNALTTGSNIIANPGTSGTIVLDTPLTINGGSTSTLTVRCNVAAGTPNGGTFSITAGAPVLTPNLVVSANINSSATPGLTSTNIGTITLDATRSGNAINVSSIPLTVTSGASGSLSGCHLYNVNNSNVPLNASGSGSLGSNNTILLDSALSVPAGGIVTLMLNCNTAAATGGSSLGLALAPASVVATNAGTGAVIAPTSGVTAAGNPLPTAGTLVFANLSSPGLPNTGEGGNAPLFAALFAVAVAGVAVGMRKLALR